MKIMKRLIAIALILTALAVGVYILTRNKNSVQVFRTEKVERGEIRSFVTAGGTLNAEVTVKVGTQVSGSIKHIYVDFNSSVKKGQLIARIDPASFEASVEQSRATLLSAKAGLRKAETAIRDGKRSLERNRELFRMGLIARSELDTSETNYEEQVASVDVANAQVSQAKAVLRIAQTNLAYTRILSPVDGIVISRNIDVGQTVAASFQTPTLFTIAQDLTRMQIDANIDEADIGRIKAGQDVEFTVDAYPETIFRGRIHQIRNEPIIVQNVVTYNAVIKVENPSLRLKPGMTANVTVIESVKKDILRIPNSALRFTPPENLKTEKKEKVLAVWVLEGGRPKRIPVVIGISDSGFTELVSGEVREGDEVLTESLAKTKGSPTVTGPRMF